MGDASTIKLPTFDGKEESFVIWRTRFRAYTLMKGFAEALSYDDNTDMSDKESDVNANFASADAAIKETGRKGKANIMAMAALAIAMTTEELICKIHEASDADWPGGKAYKVIKLLEAEYQPTDRYSLVEIRRKLNKISMKDSQDPRILFEQIAMIKNQARSSQLAIAEEDLIAIVLDKVPIQYAHVLATQQNIQGNNLTLSHLKEAMRNQYRIVNGRTDDDDNMIDETGLGGIMGRHGRRKNRSGGNDETSKNKFKGKCHHCGKKGHKKTDCFHLETNKDKRPKGFKVKEFGATCADTEVNNDCELMLVACNKSKKYTVNKCGIGSNHEVTDGNKCNGNIQLTDEVLRDKSAKVKTPVNEEFILTATEKN